MRKTRVSTIAVRLICAMAGLTGCANDRSGFDSAAYDSALSDIRRVQADPLASIPASLEAYARESRQPLSPPGTRTLTTHTFSGTATRSFSATLREVIGQTNGWLGIREADESADGSSVSTSTVDQWLLDGGLLSTQWDLNGTYKYADQIVEFTHQGHMFPLQDGNKWSYVYRNRRIVADPDTSNNTTRTSQTDDESQCSSSRVSGSLGEIPGPVWLIACRSRFTDAKGALGVALAAEAFGAPSETFYSERLGMMVEPTGRGRSRLLESGSQITDATRGFDIGDQSYGTTEMASVMDGPTQEANMQREREQAEQESQDAQDAQNDAANAELWKQAGQLIGTALQGQGKH